MGAIVTQIGSIFGAFFSRGFWLAAFMPVALTVAVHLGMASLVFPAQVPLGDWLQTATSSSLAIVPVAFAALIVLAYAVGPLAPLARGVLDGHVLPPGVRLALRRSRLSEAARGAGRLTEAKRLAAYFLPLPGRTQARLNAAAEGGGAFHAIRDPKSIDFAEWRVGLIAPAVAQGELPSRTNVEGAIEAMRLALAANDADLASHPQAQSATDLALAARLSAAWDTLNDTLRAAAGEVQFRMTVLVDAYGELARNSMIQATRMGDARQATERYTRDVYDADFDFLWPRLQLVLSDKDTFVTAVTDAKAQVDFAVMSVFLMATVPLVWTPVLVATATTPWLFLAVAGGGPLVCGFFYELAVVSQYALSDRIKAAVDRYRIDLLTTLNQAPPASRAEERAIWRRLREAENPAAKGTFDMPYKYKKEAAS